MGNRRRNKQKYSKKASNRYSITLFYFLVGCVITSGIFLVSGSTPVNSLGSSKITSGNDITLNRLLAVSPRELEKIDIALVNLLCAESLPGSENLNIEECLDTLDKWAEQIRLDTERRMPSFYKNSAKYDNSQNFFKIVNMILCLKNEIGVKYNLEIMKRKTFPDSKDVFIHGCITQKRQGGCVSIPTLCVAVGRRLGYPLKLVITREHVFFRWEDDKETFNMEACCEGCDSYPDEYYKTFPRRITEQEIKDNGLLKSLTPVEELALFLDTRGHCLFDAGKTAEAQIMYSYAYSLSTVKVRLGYMDNVVRTEIRDKYK